MISESQSSESSIMIGGVFIIVILLSSMAEVNGPERTGCSLLLWDPW